MKTAPGRIPLVGHALRLLLRPLPMFTSLREHGDIVEVRIGRMAGYFVTAPRLVWETMTGPDVEKFGRGVHHEKLRPFIGSGVFLIDGERHHRQRRLVRPAFQHQRIVKYTQTMSDCANAAIQGWRDGQIVDVNLFLHELTLDIVTKALFSTAISQDEADLVQRWLPIALHGAVRRTLAPFGILDRLPTPANRRFAESGRQLMDVGRRLIAQCRAAGAERDDIVSMLGQTGMTDQEIFDEVMTLYIGGTETAADTMGWALLLLSEHPEIEERMQAEVDEAIGGRPMTYDDLARTPYCRQVVMEVLRLYPQPLLNSRRTTSEVRLGPYLLPAGASIFFSPYGLHRDPESFPDPGRFDPDRWSPERVKLIPKHAYIPFGGGIRKCLGDIFATNEMHLILATIVDSWHLRPVPGLRPRVARRFTLGLRELRMRLEQRPFVPTSPSDKRSPT